MKSRLRVLLLVFLLSLVSVPATSQVCVTAVRGDVTPPTPESTGIVTVQGATPDLLTGTVNVSVPVYTVSLDGYELPISLQYYSSGIKVFDDPAPVGYGWKLMPALRATRTVLGRPDELYKSWLGSSQVDLTDQDNLTAAGYMCNVDAAAASIEHTERYDAEHDVFTFAMPGRTITRVSDFSQDGEVRFLGADDEEYRIEADTALMAITVIDPMGVRYVFSGVKEYYTENCGKLVPTAWALKKITLDNGRSISLNWALDRHPFANRAWMGGYSFMDSWDQLQWGNSGVEQSDFDNDNYAQAILSRCNETEMYLRLNSISFPGGEVVFSYQSSEYGSMLTEIKINNDSETVKTFALGYLGGDYTLLSEIDGGECNQYSFSYNTDYGLSPFANTGIYSQDWWGYYNAKANTSLTPKLRVRTYYSTTTTEGTYKYEIGDADRNVDSIAMQALMLKEVTWPTGGKSAFIYEPHRFAPIRQESDGEIHPDYDPYLSLGGGLRVRQVITSNADGSDSVTVQYQYPLATVRSVPSAATFVETYNVVMPFPDIPSDVPAPTAQMRLVNIMPISDYTRYDMGATLLWYDSVTTVWPQGKIITEFMDVLSSLPEPKNTFFGGRIPCDMTRVFYGSPVISKTTVYKGFEDNYEPVRSTEYEYATQFGNGNATNYHFRRELVCLGGEGTHGPDFEDGCYLRNCPLLYGGTATIEGAYSCHTYNLQPYTHRLTKKTRKEYTNNGVVTSTEAYTYLAHTELLSSVGTNVSEGMEQTITISYPNNSSASEVEAQMASANMVGIPIHEKITVGEAVTDIHAEYVRTSSGAFRQKRTYTIFGNSSDTIFTPTCEYDALGKLIKTTDEDGISIAWTWDANGRYPIKKDEDGLVTAFAYKSLVGLTSTTTPNGTTSTYEYDQYGRLIKTAISDLGTIQTSAYNFSPDDNTVTSTTHLSDSQSHSVTHTYDGLGRLSLSSDAETGLSQHFTYDAMGRQAKYTVPSTESPSNYYDWCITEYEASPRGVVVSSLHNGQAWHSADKRALVRTLTNSATGDLSCPLYSITSVGIQQTGNYTANQLLITETTDENGHTTRTYATRAGRTVMLEDGDGTSEILRTRYVYDDYGRLRFILPPSFPDGDATTTDDDFLKSCYEYKYDNFGRNTAKRFAGSEKFHTFVYSKSGRLVAEHTPAMVESQFFVYFYDSRGRKVYTGDARLSDAQLERLKQISHTASYTGMSGNAGYTITPTPQLTVNMPFAARYYDDYSHLALSGASTLPSITKTALGLPTGTVDYATGSALYTAFEYDQWGRVVKSHRQSAKGLITSAFTLDRAGNPLTETVTFSLSNGTSHTLSKTYTYDTAGRLASWGAVFNGHKASGKLTYGKYGTVATEKYGNNVKRAYDYDEHGWIKEIQTSIPNIISGEIATISPLSTSFYSNVLDAGTKITIQPLFTDYTETITYADGINPRYDGTASSHTSTIGGRYDYVFDSHDHLAKAEYTPGTDNDADEDFSTIYTYNSIGAPTQITRYGIIDITKDENDNITEDFGEMDNLTYNWDGMLLSTIDAEPHGTDFLGRTGFPSDAEATTSEYTWTAAGLLKSDTSRGITNITYNHAGQPVKITFDDTSEITYTYLADGSLSTSKTKTYVAYGNYYTLSTRTYCGDFIFKGDDLSMVNFNGGYFDGEGAPHYRHHDWQGSVTMTTDSVGIIEQHVGYYPYGELWREPDGQLYLYGSKERLRDNALNDYLFPARRLNSAICLWSIPDHLSDTFADTNPYIYCGANPIKFTDPTGCKIEGRTSSDVVMVISSLNEILEADVFNEFRQLIVRGGKNHNKNYIAPISADDRNSAFEGKILSEDQQALADIIFNTINSSQTHKIEFHGDTQILSKEATSAFLPKFMKGEFGSYMSEILEANKGLPSILMENRYGNGATTTIRNGTYSLIFLYAEHPFGVAVTVGHEIFGHGRSLSLKRESSQHVDAIRMENLIRRVMGIPDIRNGEDHGDGTIIDEPTLIPDFR